MQWSVELAFDLDVIEMTPLEESETWSCSTLTMQEDVNREEVQEEGRGDKHCESG